MNKHVWVFGNFEFLLPLKDFVQLQKHVKSYPIEYALADTGKCTSPDGLTIPALAL